MQGREMSPSGGWQATREKLDGDSLTLPNLVIAGVAKCGTTSLFALLGQHPEIMPSDVKELKYFYPLADGASDLPPLSTYADHFRGWAGQRYRLEASPRYAWSGLRVIEALHTTLPNPHVIISLRDPVKRFWSAYRYLQSRGRLPRDLSCAGYLELCERWVADPASSPVRGSALTVGMYADYLPAWFEAFGDRLRIVFAERLAADAAAEVAALCRRLDLDETGVAALDVTRRNTTIEARSRLVARGVEALRPLTRQVFRARPEVRETLRRFYGQVNGAPRTDTLDPAVAARLRELYANSNANLANLLTRRGYQQLPEWLVHQ